MIKIIAFSILLCGLLINSVEDIRERKISVALIGILFVVGMVFRIAEKTLWTWDVVYCVIPGICSLLLSWGTKNRIGAGDGLLLLVLGLYLNREEVFAVSICAIMLAGLAALLLLCLFRKPKDYEIPFVPILMTSFIIIKGCRI